MTNKLRSEKVPRMLRINREIITLRNSTQPVPLQSDFKLFTAEFQSEATDPATRRDISSETMNFDSGIFSILYPNLQSMSFPWMNRKIDATKSSLEVAVIMVYPTAMKLK
nr:hypothetical protein Iba_chr12aCG23450 [Ipomoea batatas]GMD64780.1 hypothetical protein Iba_chr12bCG27650 [Ipomoea batatas]